LGNAIQASYAGRLQLFDDRSKVLPPFGWRALCGLCRRCSERGDPNGDRSALWQCATRPVNSSATSSCAGGTFIGVLYWAKGRTSREAIMKAGLAIIILASAMMFVANSGASAAGGQSYNNPNPDRQPM
jgi:hypothetical protein